MIQVELSQFVRSVEPSVNRRVYRPRNGSKGRQRTFLGSGSESTPPGFEPGQREPKSLVLPLHYGVTVYVAATRCLQMCCGDVLPGESTGHKRARISCVIDAISESSSNSLTFLCLFWTS